jgi:hypothetical protein
MANLDITTHTHATRHEDRVFGYNDLAQLNNSLFLLVRAFSIKETKVDTAFSASWEMPARNLGLLMSSLERRSRHRRAFFAMTVTAVAARFKWADS